jgi:hypothetical protein
LRLSNVGRTLRRIERRWNPRHVTVEDERDLARIRELCRRFPEAAEGQLQDRPLFHVRRRRFALFNGDGSPARKRWREFGRSLHFVTDPRERDALARDLRYRPSPHHGFCGWMALDLHNDHGDWPEIARLLEAAYRQVATRELIAMLDAARAE